MITTWGVVEEHADRAEGEAEGVAHHEGHPQAAQRRDDLALVEDVECVDRHHQERRDPQVDAQRQEKGFRARAVSREGGVDQKEKGEEEPPMETTRSSIWSRR